MLISWVAGGIFAICGALTLAELASALVRRQEAGLQAEVARRYLAALAARADAGLPYLVQVSRGGEPAALVLLDAVAAAMDDLSPLDKQILVERHLISRELSHSKHGSGVVISRDQSHVVMINEEDHLRMQALLPGLQATVLPYTLVLFDLDGSAGSAQPPGRRSAGATALLFIGIFLLLQWGWSHCRNTWLERLVVHQATVVPAASLIRLISPEIPARAAGPSIQAPGGGINILNGCEGTEIMFLLISAFAAVRLEARRRLLGLLAGLSLAYLMNEARILALFYTYRADRAWFDLLHTTVLPAVMIALIALFFHAYVQRPAPPAA